MMSGERAGAQKASRNPGGERLSIIKNKHGRTAGFANSTNAYPRGLPRRGPDLWKRKSNLAIVPNLENAWMRVYLWNDELLHLLYLCSLTHRQKDVGFPHRVGPSIHALEPTRMCSGSKNQVPDTRVGLDM
jgi:hypothetical protein